MVVLKMFGQMIAEGKLEKRIIKFQDKIIRCMDCNGKMIAGKI